MSRIRSYSTAEAREAAAKGPDREDVPAAFTEVPAGCFKRIDKPRGSDWLKCHKETPQSFRSFLRKSFKAVPHATYRVIELTPIGPVPNTDNLARFCEGFFAGCSVRIAKGVSFQKALAGSRRGEEGQLQLLTETVYSTLSSLPPRRDVLVRVAVTMADLYPGEEWNFVYGQALVMDGLGMFSFARYTDDESFPVLMSADGDITVQPLVESQHGAGPTQTILYRTCKVVCHEVGHLFGIEHCVYFECLLCGCNHLQEFDKRPMYLCPIDLRKLQSSCGFDPVERYSTLLALAEEFGWTDYAEFLSMRLSALS